MQGKIVKGIAGFYYVMVGTQVYECKAKGIFRKDHQKPLVGDDVEMDILDEIKKIGNITEILPRKNALIRPAVANVDQALVIFAVMKPQPNFNLLDRFLVMMEQQDLSCVICFNKTDLDTDQAATEYREVYEKAGYKTITVSAKTGEGMENLLALLKGKTTTVAGPSGVGKSSLVNKLQSEIVMETGEISNKIERGKHTTRHSQILIISEDTFIFDTPGFSSLSLFDMEKEDLCRYYPEFATYEKECKFGGCSHVTEPVCGVKQAVSEGMVSKLRYENYCLLYEELKQKKRYN